MQKAARLGDTIGHSSALAGFLIGAAIGAALIIAAAVTIFTGGMCVGLLLAFGAALAPSLPAIGAALGSMIRSPTGSIASGSPNVFINKRPAARATLSTAICAKDPSLLMVATGSGSVNINGHAAARENDAITCGAKIDSGSPNVFIGAQPTAEELPVKPEISKELQDQIAKYFQYAELALAVMGLTALVRNAVKFGVRAVLPCSGKALAGVALGLLAGKGGERLGKLLSGQEGNPVDLASGRKILRYDDEVDFILKGQLDIVCARFYASDLALTQAPGMLGQGWRMLWERQLHLDAEGIVYTDGEGRQILLPHLPCGNKLFIDSEHQFWCRLADGRYLLADMEQLYLLFSEFDADGRARLVRMENGCGSRLNLHYDAQGQLAVVQNSSGQGVRLHHTHGANASRLTHITRWSGPGLGVSSDDTHQVLVRYHYDQAGCLIAVENAQQEICRAFRYYEGVMVWQKNQAGLVCSYEWQILQGMPRVTRQRDNCGKIYSFTYHFAQSETQVQQHHLDAEGKEIPQGTARWRFNQQMRVVAATDYDGLCYQVNLDQYGNLQQVMLPGERCYRLQNDEFGRCTDFIDPLGRQTRFQYHAEGNAIAAMFFADGSHFGYTYDLRGLLTSRIDALGNSERFTYDQWGQLLETTDAGGNQKYFVWDERNRGLLRYSRDCSGQQDMYEYDERGQLCRYTNAAGVPTCFEYDSLGRMVRIRYADGSKEEWEYNDQGLLAQTKDAAGHCLRWQYNPRAQVLRQIDAMGQELQYEYDPGGNLQRLINQNGAACHFTYDPCQRLLVELRIDGVRRHLRWQHGLLASSVLEGGVADTKQDAAPQIVHYFEYDADAQLLVHHHPSATTRYTWDICGRLQQLVKVPSEAGRRAGIKHDSLRFEYDRNGRLIAEHSSAGCVRVEVDALGLPASLHLPGQQCIQWSRYGSGHVHQMRFAHGGQMQVISDFERDALHRDIVRTQGALSQHTGYDLLGRKWWQCALAEDPGWQRPQMTHADWREPLSMSALQKPPHANSMQQTSIWQGWNYRANGELGSHESNLHGMRQYFYSKSGLLEQMEYSRDGRLQRSLFSYDAAGNLEQRKSGGRLENNRLRVWQHLRFEYDAFGNLIRKHIGQHQVQEFTYDAAGQLLSIHQQLPRQHILTRFQYDALGRRIEKVVEHRQQTNGQAMSEQASTKRSTWFVWQGLRMLQEITSTAANDANILQVASRAGNSVRTWLYDPTQDYVPLACVDQRIAVNGQLDAASQTYWCHTDHIGTPQALTDSHGLTVWRGEYSAWGKLDKAANDSVLQNLRFQGQYADQESGLHYNTFRYYDPDIGRFTTQDPIGLAGGENVYQYAPNPTGWVDPWGLSPLDKLAERGFFGVVQNTNGGLDYANSNALYNKPGINPIQKIGYTGDYIEDFKKANMGAFGKTTTPKNYVWHHLDDYNPATNRGTMQLVHQDAHSGISHRGGVAQYQQATGKKYTFPCRK